MRLLLIFVVVNNGEGHSVGIESSSVGMESWISIMSEWNHGISSQICAFCTILGYGFWCNSQVF